MCIGVFFYIITPLIVKLPVSDRAGKLRHELRIEFS